jgi:hypothetical protein
MGSGEQRLPTRVLAANAFGAVLVGRAVAAAVEIALGAFGAAPQVEALEALRSRRWRGRHRPLAGGRQRPRTVSHLESGTPRWPQTVQPGRKRTSSERVCGDDSARPWRWPDLQERRIAARRSPPGTGTRPRHRLRRGDTRHRRRGPESAREGNAMRGRGPAPAAAAAQAVASPHRRSRHRGRSHTRTCPPQCTCRGHCSACGWRPSHCTRPGRTSRCASGGGRLRQRPEPAGG